MYFDMGKHLASLRNKKHLTQQQLAELINVTPQAVSRWENNITSPDLSMIVILANIFDVSLEYLLKGEKE